MTITLVAMAVILIAGVSVMVVATVAHVLDRSRRLRLWFRARYVALAAWSCRVRRLTGHRLGRIASTTHWPGNRAVG